MKAIRVRQFGAPDVMVVEDVPDPTPGDGEVLVKIHAAGVNPVETYVRAGTYASLPPLPFTPGVDAAGVVLRVGAGVTHVLPGARVYVTFGGQFGATGSYAEQMLSPASGVFPLPDRVSFAQGAAIGVPYSTAWRALHAKAHVQPGETVLVHGASGGTGLAAVQIARAAGLTVIGTAGTDAGRALVAEQGAHHALDHGRDGYRDEIKRVTNERGPDVIVEMLANVNLQHDLAMIARHGRVVVIGSRGNVEITPRHVMASEATVTGFMMWNAPEHDLRRAHAGLAAGLSLGTLTPVIREELPLADAPRAHRWVMEPGAYGKIVLVP